MIGINNGATLRKYSAILCALGWLSAAPAHAGGFSLPVADTDILFTEGNFSIRIGALGIFPNQSFSTIRGQRVGYANYVDPIPAPSFAVKFRIAPELSCAFHFSYPYGIEASYNLAAQNAQALSFAEVGLLPNATRSIRLTTQEYGTTCAASANVGPGKLYVLGGGFLEGVQYRENTRLGTLNLEQDAKAGYRVGLAYAVPEYAMRMQVMYRSAVDHALTGNFTLGPLASAIGLSGGPLVATGAGTLPQSVRVYAQTGIAPQWLVYGAFTWVNWSVLPQFGFTIDQLGPSSKILGLRDGFTTQVGVGHAFTDRLSGTVNLNWDTKTGSAAFILPASVGVGLGLEYKTDYGKIASGVLLARLSGGSQTFAAGATVDGTAGPGYAVVTGLSYLLDF
ncbi:MAG: long-chain fatty acid transporter [Methylorubrum populi]